MREIKFRGISKRTGKMVYGDFLRCSFGHGEGVAIKDTVNHVNDGYQDLIPEEIIQGTESQFTGLKDKNGAEIYESDIVNYHFIEDHLCCTVMWNKERCCFGFKDKGEDVIYGVNTDDVSKRAVVIGNIYENQNLLEELS